MVGGAKATCGVSHTSGVISLDRDTISSTCSLSTSAFWGGHTLCLSGGYVLWNWWWNPVAYSARPGQSSHISCLENSMV